MTVPPHPRWSASKNGGFLKVAKNWLVTGPRSMRAASSADGVERARQRAENLGQILDDALQEAEQSVFVLDGRTTGRACEAQVAVDGGLDDAPTDQGALRVPASQSKPA